MLVLPFRLCVPIETEVANALKMVSGNSNTQIKVISVINEQQQTAELYLQSEKKHVFLSFFLYSLIRDREIETQRQRDSQRQRQREGQIGVDPSK